MNVVTMYTDFLEDCGYDYEYAVQQVADEAGLEFDDVEEALTQVGLTPLTDTTLERVLDTLLLDHTEESVRMVLVVLSGENYSEDQVNRISKGK